MNVEVDFKELYNFADNLKNKHDLDTTLMTATQNVARVLHDNLRLLTPVRTGNLRKMWSAGDNLVFTVDKVKNGYKVTFVNTARADSKDGYMYGIAVNDGHSTPTGGWVMGRFFVENSIIMTAESKQIERIIYKELQKWWEEC